MGKTLKKQQARLKARQAKHNGSAREGRRPPGSMNRHKSFSLGKKK